MPCPCSFQAEILATCQENINGMSAMLRGPTVTVLSPRRCQEMRGKRIKVFVVMGSAAETAIIPSTTTTTTNSTNNNNSNNDIASSANELCRCEQFRKKLTTLCRRLATVPRSMLGIRRSNSSSSGRGSSSSLIGHDRDRMMSRFIFYAKVTILTELFGFLRGLCFSIPSVGYS